MPRRHETTPPWGKKRKHDNDDRKRLRIDTIHQPHHRPTPWAKHSDPLSPTSLATPPKRHANESKLQQAEKAMFDWTQSDRPVEESLTHMRRIVDLCQDEPSWSGDKNWKQIIASYHACGAAQDAIQDLRDAREPFWTQTRIRHASTTLGTPRALADSIRTMVAESERANGHYLDRELRDQLMKAVERVFPCTQPVILIPDSTFPSPAAEDALVDAVHQQTQPSVAPVAHMAKPYVPSMLPPPPPPPSIAPPDPRLATRPPGWAPSLNRDVKLQSDALVEPPDSRKSSAATLVISSPILPPESPEPSQVTKPKRPVRFVPEAAKSVNPEHSHSNSSSPSLSKAAALPIQFKIATGSNSAPVKRPRFGSDSDIAIRSAENTSPDRRTSLPPNSTVQAPTGPRSLPSFQAKITPKEPLRDTREHRRAILRACDDNNVPAQDATPCPDDDRAWLLHFRDHLNMQSSLGKTIFVRDILVPVLTHAPGQSFQTFAFKTPFSLTNPKSGIDISKVGDDIINAIARVFAPHKFILQKQKGSRGGFKLKWLVVFEEALERENFTLNVTIGARREGFDFFALPEDAPACWVCLGSGHCAARCAFTDIVVLPYRDGQYLSSTPQMK
ncbi:hypothetical protein E4T47_01630 [Aureobasidium subglaciale]|nr:hypothetical protein E4T47_01630 [Aureobasidium subglaciale]